MIPNIHPRKRHLTNLPAVPEGAIPKWEAKEDAPACLCIPVYTAEQSKWVEHNPVEAYVAKSAAWALRTWKLNSDAESLGIPIYIYIESDSYADIIPILKQNHVPDANIKVSASILPEYAKSLNPLFDPDLEQFKQIQIADADTFIIADAEKLPIFGRSTARPWNVVSAAYSDMTPFLSSASAYWIDRLFYVNAEDEWVERPDRYPEWLDKVEKLTSASVRKRLESPGNRFQHYVASWWCFNREVLSLSDLAFMKRAALELGDDEAAMCLWSLHYQKGFRYLADLGIRHILEIDERFTQDVLGQTRQSRPYMLHFGASIEQAFEKAIGAC